VKYEIDILVEREKTYLFKKKIDSEWISFGRDISKILIGPFFLGHPLVDDELTIT